MNGLLLTSPGPGRDDRVGPWSTPWRQLDAHLLEWATGGAWQLTTADGTTAIPAGRVLVVPARCRHRLSVQAGERLRTTWLLLRCESPPGLDALRGWSFPTMLPVPAGHQVRRMAEALAHAGPDEVRAALRRQAAGIAIVDLLAAAGTPPAAPDEAAATRLAPLLAFIDANLAGHLPIARLARELGVRRARLHALFAEVLHCPPGEYIIRRRLLRAQDLLARTDRSLDSIADACGIVTASYLCRLFKARLGRSPAAWRRGLQTAAESVVPGPPVGRV
jgi:AraC-like DNA-binding protein